jgi:hypothetical protein
MKLQGNCWEQTSLEIHHLNNLRNFGKITTFTLYQDTKLDTLTICYCCLDGTFSAKLVHRMKFRQKWLISLFLQLATGHNYDRYLVHHKQQRHISFRHNLIRYNSRWIWPSDTKTKTTQEVLGRTNRLLSLIRHGPHWKRRVQQFFYCFVCIRYRGKVSTEPSPSNDRGIHIRLVTETDGRDILIRPLRWAQVPWYTYQVS